MNGLIFKVGVACIVASVFSQNNLVSQTLEIPWIDLNSRGVEYEFIVTRHLGEAFLARLQIPGEAPEVLQVRKDLFSKPIPEKVHLYFDTLNSWKYRQIINADSDEEKTVDYILDASGAFFRYEHEDKIAYVSEVDAELSNRSAYHFPPLLLACIGSVLTRQSGGEVSFELSDISKHVDLVYENQRLAKVLINAKSSGVTEEFVFNENAGMGFKYVNYNQNGKVYFVEHWSLVSQSPVDDAEWHPDISKGWKIELQKEGVKIVLPLR